MAVFEKLAAVRAQRPQSARDAKVIAGWIGLAIAALTEATFLLSDPEMALTAVEVAEYVHAVHWDSGGDGVTARLHRNS